MNIPPEVRSSLLDPHRIREIDAVPAGLSGSSVFRCRGEQDWALKCYPHATTASRVQEIHRVILALSKRNPLVPGYGLPATGKPGSFIVHRDRVWELQRWIVGKPLPTDAPLERVMEGALAIHRLHRDLQDLSQRQENTAASIAGISPVWGRPPTRGQAPTGPRGQAPAGPLPIGPIPAIEQRVERISVLRAEIPRCWQLSIDLPTDLTGPVHRALQRLRTSWNSVWPELLVELNRCHSLPLVPEPPRMGDPSRPSGPVQYVFRDIHREHVHFEDNQVRGVIDFDAIRVDIPATDLARWLGSFECFWNEPSTIDLVLDKLLAEETRGGSSTRMSWLTQMPVDSARTLICSLARSGLWISLGNWVVWLLLEKRQFGNREKVASRIGWLLKASSATV